VSRDRHRPQPPRRRAETLDRLQASPAQTRRPQDR
jgi:hypothetical protein